MPCFSPLQRVLSLCGLMTLAGLISVARAAPVGCAQEGTLPAQSAAAQALTQTAWQRFKQDHVSADGRVIDLGSADLHSTSEGQSYGLFFALVNNDPVQFQRLLSWTENNLAQGDLGQNLPAWSWGHDEDGNWGILDSNSASDSDVWIAYSLLEAGRLWQQPRYSALGQRLSALILAREVTRIPGLGLTLLPAPRGFHPANDSWRLNPSYLPVQLLRRLAMVSANTAANAGSAAGSAAWNELAASAERIIIDTAVKGYAPDWTLYKTGKGFLPDVQTQADGSYNAIRVYLWAGMMSPADPFSIKLKTRFYPLIKSLRVQGSVPEHVNTATGVVSGQGPVGFGYAVLPLLLAMSTDDEAHVFAQAYQETLYTRPVSGYYNRVLTLFGQSWAEGGFRFGPDGTLLTSWTC